MNIEALIDRADQLLNTKRYELALKETLNVLAIEPKSFRALEISFLCYLNLNKYSQAMEFSDLLIASFPEKSTPYYYKSCVFFGLNNLKEAETFISQAISINPNLALFYGKLANINYANKLWSKSLVTAQKGLSLDPENTLCNNVRNLSLARLGQYEILNESIKSTLILEPDNPITHTNIGWAKLISKDYKEAQIHFAEALKLDPNIDEARSGMLEALKSKYLFYRLFLRYYFWVSNYKKQVRIGILIGVVILYKALNKLALQYKFLMPFVLIIGLAIVLTYFIKPFFNVVMRFHKYGKYLISEKENKAAKGMGRLLFVFFAVLLILIITNL